MPQLILLALLAFPCMAADWWKVSAVTYAGAMTADAASSWNKREMNPLLQDRSGRFNARGVSIKAGITVGVLVGEWLILRKWPKFRKTVIVTNFGLSGAMTGVAIYNTKN